MNCPKCHKWNLPENRFCVACGSPLSTTSNNKAQIPEVLINELRQLRQIVDRNYESMNEVNDRLSALEDKLGIQETIEEKKIPTLEKAEISNITVTPETTTPKVEVWEPTPSPQPVIPQRPPKPAKPPGEWEQILGGSWLARIGVFALLIGIGFFLKYAFDRNWIGPSVRVLLGGLAGLVLLGGGYLWRKKYPIMTQVLTGGAVGIMYLSVFAAFSAYDLIPFLVAVILLLFICIISVFFALRYNSMGLAILGIIGAFIAPLMLGFFGADGIHRSLEIPIYIVIVDLGVLFVSTLRNWRWFTLLALSCTLLIFGIAYGIYNEEIGVLAGEVFLTVFFLIFVGATVLFHILQHKTPNIFDYALMVFNAAFYFGFSYLIMWDTLREWMGGFSLLVALFYGGLAFIIHRRSTENKILSLFSIGVALVFLTVALPVQLDDHAWATIAWATQATILLWLSFRTRTYLLRVFSYIVFVLTTIRLLFFDTMLPMGKITPVLNERGLAFLFSIALVYLCAYLIRKYKNSQQESEQALRYMDPVFLIAADFFTLWFIGAEVITNSQSLFMPKEAWPLVFLIVLVTFTTLQYLVWRRIPERYDYVLLAVNAIFYMIMTAVVWADFRDWMGGLYFFLSIIHFGLTYGALKRKEESKQLGFFAFCIGAIYFTTAIPIQLGDSIWTTIAWAAEFTGLMWLARNTMIPWLRYFSYGVFACTVIHLLFFDTVIDIASLHPIINERFLAFVTSIAAIYISIYLLWRNKEWPEWKPVAYTSLISANLLTIVVLSLELWDFFEIRALESVKSSTIESAQNLSLTALWLVYAVILLIIGIAKRSRPVRIGSLILIAIPVLKVFIYDVFKLEMIYRIVAFVGLGIILLVGGYLYQRYSSRIREFLIHK